MLGHRHILSSLPRQCTRFKILRTFSSTSSVASPAQTEGEGEEQGEGDWSAPKDPTWAVWKQSIGKQFEKPQRPCNWLGDKVVESVSVCIKAEPVTYSPIPSALIALPTKPLLQTPNSGF